MHVDARQLDQPIIVDADICIIGAGAAGISMALQWIGSDKKVVLLEAGGFEYDEKLQQLYKGEVSGVPYYPIEATRQHFFGGTTASWAGFCSVLDPIDFRERAWVPHSGWPIDHHHLEPYYTTAHDILELPPYDYSGGSAGAAEVQSKPLIPSNDTIWNKMWYLSPPTRFGKKYRERIVNATNIHLYTHAAVTELLQDENGSIRELVFTNLEGRSGRVQARNFVLACCAIQNARLLLASKGRSERGIGNQNDNVGRYFMEHIQHNAADLYLAEPQALDMYRLQFFHTKRRAELAINANKQSQLQILNTTAALTPKAELAEREQRKYKPGEAPDALLRRWKKEEDLFHSGQIPEKPYAAHQQYVLFVRTEQAPNRDSRVTLSSEKDALGLNRVNLHWKLSDLERNSFRKFCEVVGKQLGVMNIGRIRIHEWLADNDTSRWSDALSGAYDHMGTTRMHNDPRQGVVDVNCKVHGVANLYVAGSSCFPTAGIANATLPLIALTLRLSDHLRKNG